MSFSDFVILFSFILEVGVLQYMEYKAWKTLFTPLSFLMLPYLVVLIITLFISGTSFGFVPFYYPSILIWHIGIFLFAIPSFTIAYIMQRKGLQMTIDTSQDSMRESEMPRLLIILSLFLSLLFLWHLRSTLSSSKQALGSDEFGEDFSGFGFWGHLRIFTIPLYVICMYYVGKKRWWLWFPVIVFTIVSVLNQVKGWTIIPILAALTMRIYTGRTKLTLRLLIIGVLGMFAIFFTFYAMSILVVQDRGVSDDFMDFIFGHFFHYLTSGTYGWSMDVERGIPDDGGSFEMIIAQLVNLAKSATGDKELVSPINTLFFFSGRSLTNVRTIFGTLYINTTAVSFTLYTLILSTIIYSMKLLALKYANIYTYTVYFFYITLLFMGWFDLYFANLTIFESAVMLFFLFLFDWLVVGNRFIARAKRHEVSPVKQ